MIERAHHRRLILEGGLILKCLIVPFLKVSYQLGLLSVDCFLGKLSLFLKLFELLIGLTVLSFELF